MDEDFIRLSEVMPEQVDWLWPSRIALGEISLLDGNPGDGKSAVALDLAARITTGRQMPDGTECPAGGVVLLLGEDSVSKTVVPRLKASGARMSRISVATKALSIPDDIQVIQEAVAKVDANLLVVDPLMVFLGREANRDQSVRQALTPLKELAARLNLAVLLVRHLTKSGGRLAMYRGSGSIGVIAAARSGLLVGKDPKDPNLRVLAHVKNNLGPLAQSLLFEPVDGDGQAMTIKWHGPCSYSADDLLKSSSGYGEKLNIAKAFILDLLKTGPVPQNEIHAKAARIAIAEKTLRRAKDELLVESRRQGGRRGRWIWALPHHVAAKGGQ